MFDKVTDKDSLSPFSDLQKKSKSRNNVLICASDVKQNHPSCDMWRYQFDHTTLDREKSNYDRMFICATVCSVGFILTHLHRNSHRLIANENSDIFTCVISCALEVPQLETTNFPNSPLSDLIIKKMRPLRTGFALSKLSCIPSCKKYPSEKSIHSS